MRLLQINDNGTFGLTEFGGTNIPPYAILSHTWGEGEVLFRDIVDGTGKDKPGYCKLTFCGKQAANDGLQYFWVDTCCIDKSSSLELSEAINSMFDWYRNASKCYAYLFDVSSAETDPLYFFRYSRWFTRSWTLQEILAPANVEFFSSEGVQIGNKASLLQEIHKITGIPVRAIQGSPLSEFTVEERMFWAARRRALLEEDVAYCLFGIFNVHMPLNYGEGRLSALRRLEREVNETSGQDQLRQSSDQRYYRPLADDGFRVFTLDPDRHVTTITGNIEEYSLLDPPSYFALSYVWGQEPEIHRMRINNQDAPIRPNLFYALQRIRALQLVQPCIWVDSICINQLDDLEKNSQVRRMAQIYNKASGVLIWLGEEDSTSKLAIEFVTTIYEEKFLWDGQWWENYGFTALGLLLERPWFRRGWVLQEAAFSTNSIVQCGDRQVTMNRFSKVLKDIRTRINDEPLLVGLKDDRTRLGTLANFLDSPAMSMLDMIEGAFDRSAEGVIINHKMSLESLVQLSIFSDTSNERDTIYALLNLAKDMTSPSHSSQKSLVVPDYRKSILDVYLDFILHCCDQSESLDIICRPWAPTPSSQGQNIVHEGPWNEKPRRFPSWISPRDNLPYGNPSWRLKYRLHGNPLTSSNHNRIYNAHAETKPLVTAGRTRSNTGLLSVRGILLGEVSKRSQRMANAIITTECLEVLGQTHHKYDSDPLNVLETVWRILCAGWDAMSGPALQTYGLAMIDLVRMSFSDLELSSLTNLLEYMSSIDIEELMDLNIEEHVKTFLSVVRDVIWNRRAFQSEPNSFTKRHLVGLIPQHARIGDQICILYGCSVPVVLRKHPGSNGYPYWHLIGDAYVHGVMDGEAIRESSKEALESVETIFNLR
jgi:hypothetical protein